MKITHSLVPWISVPVGAIDFYKSAFDAIEVYHHDDPSGGVVVRLSVNGAEFWLSQESPDRIGPSAEPIGGGTIRLILTVPSPDETFARALKAGAKEVYPVSEGHGWRIGRLADPFGLHWEIGHPLTQPEAHWDQDFVGNLPPIIVPAKRILEVLYHPELAAMRKQHYEKLTKSGTQG